MVGNTDYNKKVLDHFKNPRNMGSIDNPDAEATVGNLNCGDVMKIMLKVKENVIEDIKFQTMGCLPPDEEISISGKWVEIKFLKEGDIIINRRGEETEITKIYKRIFKGKMIKIVPFISKFNSFSTTFYHPILTVKRKFLKSARKSGKCKWMRIDEKELKKFKPVYVEAEYLSEGDYLIFPKIRKLKDNKKFTRDTMRLLGYYLSEGYVTSNETYVNFAFHKKEREYIEEIKEIIKRMEIKSYSERTRDNVTEVRIYSPKLSKFLIENCGKGSKLKKISEQVLILPFKKQWNMLETYINGDGNVHKRRKKDSPTYRIDTVSRNLAIQVQEILARGNIFSSIKKFDKKGNKIKGRLLKDHTLYNISFKLERNHNFVKKTKDYFLIPIKKILKEDYSGQVYNLEVKDENSYLARGFVVHNCAAAIATSSMMTEMAKGKTIDEAKKITNKDVSRALGELPPIKTHCSNLAADALRKAIENFEGK